MICPICNAENNEDAKVCANCGARLDIGSEDFQTGAKETDITGTGEPASERTEPEVTAAEKAEPVISEPENIEPEKVEPRKIEPEPLKQDTFEMGKFEPKKPEGKELKKSRRKPLYRRTNH